MAAPSKGMVALGMLLCMLAAVTTAVHARPVGMAVRRLQEDPPMPMPTAGLCTTRCFDGRAVKVDCSKVGTPETSPAVVCGDQSSQALKVGLEAPSAEAPGAEGPAAPAAETPTAPAAEGPAAPQAEP